MADQVFQAYELTPETEDGSAPESIFAYNELLPNLVEAFEEHMDGRKALGEIATKVLDDFHAAWDGLSDHRDKFTKAWKFFMSEMPKRLPPFEDSANIHVPNTFENIMRIDLQVQQELFGDWTNVFRFVPNANTPEEKEQCEALNLHLDWQVNEGIPSFKMEHQRGTLLFCFDGNVISVGYRDQEKRQNCHEILTPDDFFCPAAHVSVAPDLSDLPFYGRILRWYKHQLQSYRGTWANVDKVLDGTEPSWHGDPDAPLSESVNKKMGVDSEGETDAPYKLIHYEGWLELPNQENQRFCQVILDHDSENVLALRIQEEDDWRDRQRYDMQVSEREAYLQAMEAYSGAMDSLAGQQETLLLGLSASPLMPPEVKQQQAMNVLGAPLPQAPMRPEWMMDDQAEPEAPRRVPLLLWSRGIMIHNLAGFYGSGFGQSQADFNRTMNILGSQFVDQASLGNCPPMVTTQLVDFDGGFKVGPGVINKLKSPQTNLKEEIMFLPIGQANPQLVDFMTRIQGWAMSSGQAQDVLSGAPGKSGETWRGQSQRVEQAQKPLSVIAQRYGDFLKRQAEVNAKLNATFMEEEEILQVVDARAGLMKQIRVGAALYRKGYKVRIQSDLRFTPDAIRVQEATEMLQFPQVCPPLAQNLAFWWHAAKGYLEARHMYGLIPLLGPEPPMPIVPFGLMPPAPPGAPGAPSAPNGAPSGPPRQPN